MSNGKGSKPRPTNLKEYGANYDSIFWKKQYIGKSIQEIENLGRIASVDGIGMALTADYLPDRLNFDIENNIVVDVFKG